MSFRFTAVLLVALVLLGGYYYFAHVGGGYTWSTPSPWFWFYNVNEEDISIIKVTQEGKSVLFVKDDQGGWHFDAPDGPDVNVERWGGVTLLLEGPKSARLLTEQAEDPSQFGLEDPETVIEVGLRGGEGLSVLVGDKTPDGYKHYTQIKDFAPVHLIDSSWAEVIARLVTEPPYIPASWLYDIIGEDLVSVKLNYKGSSGFFVKDEKGKWHFDTAEGSEVDVARWTGIPILLEGPKSVMVFTMEAENLARFGLENPQMLIELRGKGERSLTIHVGDAAESGDTYYAKMKDKDPVHLVERNWVEILMRLVTEPPRVKPTS